MNMAGSKRWPRKGEPSASHPFFSISWTFCNRKQTGVSPHLPCPGRHAPPPAAAPPPPLDPVCHGQGPPSSGAAAPSQRESVPAGAGPAGGPWGSLRSGSLLPCHRPGASLHQPEASQACLRRRADWRRPWHQGLPPPQAPGWGHQCPPSCTRPSPWGPCPDGLSGGHRQCCSSTRGSSA